MIRFKVIVSKEVDKVSVFSQSFQVFKVRYTVLTFYLKPKSYKNRMIKYYKVQIKYKTKKNPSINKKNPQ